MPGLISRRVTALEKRRPNRRGQVREVIALAPWYPDAPPLVVWAPPEQHAQTARILSLLYGEDGQEGCPPPSWQRLAEKRGARVGEKW